MSRNSQLYCFIFQKPYLTVLGEGRLFVISLRAGRGWLSAAAVFPIVHTRFVWSFCKFFSNLHWVPKL